MTNNHRLTPTNCSTANNILTSTKNSSCTQQTFLIKTLSQTPPSPSSLLPTPSSRAYKNDDKTKISMTTATMNLPEASSSGGDEGSDERDHPSQKRNKKKSFSKTINITRTSPSLITSFSTKNCRRSSLFPVEGSWSATSTIFIALTILFLTNFDVRPVFCDRYFMPRHMASNIQPLASYFMSNFPNSFTSSSSSSSVPTSSLTTSGLGVVSLLPVSLPFISKSGNSGNSFIPHSFASNNNECEYNGNAVMDVVLDRMRNHLTEEKIVVQNGAITIYDASIVRFVELSRIRNSCIRKMEPSGNIVQIPFEAEIRAPQVSAKLKYNFYVTDIYGDYAGNFSHIRMNGTLEANLEEEYLSVANFNITDSRIVGDSIVFSYVPKWILDWVRSYFDSDNTELYQHLAKSILQREADTFRHFEMIRESMAIGEANLQMQQAQQAQHQLLLQSLQAQQQQVSQNPQNPQQNLNQMQGRDGTGNEEDEDEEDSRMPMNII